MRSYPAAASWPDDLCSRMPSCRADVTSNSRGALGPIAGGLVPNGDTSRTVPRTVSRLARGAIALAFAASIAAFVFLIYTLGDLIVH